MAALIGCAAPAHAASAPASDTPSHPPQAQSIVPPDEGGTKSGVITPPPVIDPGMTRPAPDAKAFPTPVIPPPGSPGGNPQVVPK